mmetsp:Transcript_28265/g.81359  ORF Transcript_28265/g.81359 Transcript_28265/m.81359 type:complete len:341 (+) Transcript_28265:1466-2488(+)
MPPACPTAACPWPTPRPPATGIPAWASAPPGGPAGAGPRRRPAGGAGGAGRGRGPRQAGTEEEEEGEEVRQGRGAERLPPPPPPPPQPHLRAGGAHGAVLEKKGQDRGHGQTAVCDLRVKPPLTLLRVADGAAAVGDAQDACVLVVARGPGGVGLVVVQFDETREEHNLSPAGGRHLGNRSEAMGHIRELQTFRRRQVTREPVVLRRNEAHRRKHGNAAMLELRGPPALEVLGVAIRCEAGGVPEPDRRLDAKLGLEGPGLQAGARREPHLGARAAHGAVLEQHAHNGHHSQTPVCELCVQLLLPDLGIDNRWSVGDAKGAKLVIVGPVLDLREAHDEAG